MQSILPTCMPGQRSNAKAGMAELADAADSKSADRKVIGVRPPVPAPANSKYLLKNDLSIRYTRGIQHQPQEALAGTDVSNAKCSRYHSTVSRIASSMPYCGRQSSFSRALLASRYCSRISKLATF